VSIAGSTPGILGGGGGGTLPDAPADVLLDATKPSTVLGLNASGVGEALNAASALARIGAVPTTRTIAGLDLSADRSASDINTALGTVSGSRILLPTTGWTDVVSGTASVTRPATGSATFNTANNSYLNGFRASITTAECPLIEVMGRFTCTTSIPTLWYTSLALSDASDTRGFVAQVHETGFLSLYQNTGSGYVQVATAGTFSLTSGVWIRLIVTPSYASSAWGTSGSSTPPTTWNTTASVATNVAVLAGGFLSRVSVRSGRTATGSGTYTVQWTDLQYRILGVAP